MNMLDGVNILKTTPIIDFPYCPIGICLMIIAAITYLIIVTKCQKAKTKTISNRLFMCYVITVIVCVFVSVIPVKTDAVKYECTIDDNIALSIVKECYDITNVTMKNNQIVYTLIDKTE